METLGPPEGGLEGWLATSMWYSMVAFLVAWDPFPQDWPNVSAPLNMTEKALQVVREILEKPSAEVALGEVG